jgi:hypothetical protein
VLFSIFNLVISFFNSEFSDRAVASWVSTLIEEIWVSSGVFLLVISGICWKWSSSSFNWITSQHLSWKFVLRFSLAAFRSSSRLSLSCKFIFFEEVWLWKSRRVWNTEKKLQISYRHNLFFKRLKT